MKTTPQKDKEKADRIIYLEIQKLLGNIFNKIPIENDDLLKLISNAEDLVVMELKEW